MSSRSANSPASGPSGALKDLRVVDLTQMLAGPYVTLLLADQGAEIIKIEPLESGDMTRSFGPFAPDDTVQDFGGYFQSINRNKKSIAVDLKTPKGKEIVRRLATSADILVENFRAGVMERLELSYESLAALNPKLIYATVRGFGDPRSGTSPYLDWPAFDVVAQAMGGFMGITGAGPGQPLKAGPGIGDMVPAMLATIGILTALRHAEKTGQGQFVDVAMFDGMLALSERQVFQHAYTGEIPTPEGNRHPLLVPFGVFPAADGWVAIACARDHFWAALAVRMQRPDLARHPDFASNADRLARRDQVIDLVSAWTRRHTKAQLKEMLGGVIPFGPVNDVAEILADPHVAARNLLAHVEQPHAAAPVTIVNTPIRMSETQGGVYRRAPLLGEHTIEILQALAYSDTDIAALLAENIVQSTEDGANR